MKVRPISKQQRRDDDYAWPRGRLDRRTLSPRRYVELGRGPRLDDLPVRSPPYLEAAATAAAFLFLLYVILGGA
jgi:hypothetical protein